MWEQGLLSVLCKWEGDKLSGKRFKIFFFPASAWAGKKENSAVQNSIVLVFFFFEFEEKENEFGSDPKIGYDKYDFCLRNLKDSINVIKL
jgi:hypothetical protein